VGAHLVLQLVVYALDVAVQVCLSLERFVTIGVCADMVLGSIGVVSLLVRLLVVKADKPLPTFVTMELCVFRGRLVLPARLSGRVQTASLRARGAGLLWHMLLEAVVVAGLRHRGVANDRWGAIGLVRKRTSSGERAWCDGAVRRCIVLGAPCRGASFEFDLYIAVFRAIG
jgi:hypothetical protein